MLMPESLGAKGISSTFSNQSSMLMVAFDEQAY